MAYYCLVCKTNYNARIEHDMSNCRLSKIKREQKLNHKTLDYLISMYQKKDFPMKQKWFFPKLRKALYILKCLKQSVKLVESLYKDFSLLYNLVSRITLPSEARELVDKIYQDIIDLKGKVVRLLDVGDK